MKRIAQLLTVLTAVLFSSSAWAVVDPYEALEITPAEGEVTSLQHFTITFAGLPVEVNEEAVPTLEKGGGATYNGTMRAGEDGTTVYIDFEENCTASGHYFLNLPENSLKVNGQRMLPLTFRFNISGTMESFYDQITINPAEGEVGSLQNFTISFPEFVGEIAYGSKAILTNNTTHQTYRAEMYDVRFTVLIYFPQEITEAGEYTLTIPAGSVMFYTMDEQVHELNFNYNVVGIEPSFYDKITIDPDEGIVESLQNFTIKFPMDVDYLAPDVMATLTNTTTGTSYDAAMNSLDSLVFVSCDEEITNPGRYTLTIPVGAVIIEALGEEVSELKFNYMIPEAGMPDYTINPPEGEVHILQYFTIAYGQDVVVDEAVHPTLSNDSTGESFECNLIEIGGNAVVYKEYPLSVVGNYTLTVPAKCISIDATGQTNPEMTFHYALVEKETYVPPVIESQPEGEVRLYRRTGGVVREVEKSYTIEEGENPYELVFEQQEGALTIVFADSNKVYIQRPVSWSYYDGWVEGTLSEDGKTITVPMGQYIAYAKSLEMAVQVGVFVYDESAETYFYEEAIDELYYTVNDDGSISQEDTDQSIILGTMNRAFGDNFQYLDYEWLQSGDYGSVYIPINELPITPPAGMSVHSMYLTTAVNDGMEWEPYTAKVNVGFDGNDMWLQGISEFLPKAWIKGVREGNKIIFPNSQLLGANDALLYFKCAEFNPVNGNTTQKDMELTINDDGTYSTFDYVFITADKDNLYYINYYQGLTLSRYPDVVTIVPDDLEVKDYIFTYKTKASPVAPLINGQTKVKVGFFEDMVFIQGLWEYMPDAWVGGTLEDGKLVMNLAQFMGNYKEEYSGVYPIFLTAFDNNTGLLLPQVTFTYNAGTRSFHEASSPLSIGINKTGYLSLQDFFECALIPENSGVESIIADDVYVTGYYDLQGRQFNEAPTTGGIYIIKYSDGTTRKVLRK